MVERLGWTDFAGTGTPKPTTPKEGSESKPTKAKSSTRRWVCPKCHTIIRSTKEVRVMCADCGEMFIQADSKSGQTESEGTSESSTKLKKFTSNLERTIHQ